MKRALGFLVVAGLIGGAVWIGVTSGRDVVIVTDRGSVSIRESEGAEDPTPRCDVNIPFEPAYLPEGFRHEQLDGPFPGGRPPDDQSSTGGKRDEVQVIVHYRGPAGRAIEIRRPGTLFAELAQRNDAPRIEVLGTETTGFAPIGPGGNKFIVQFEFPPSPKPHRWCSLYSLNEYGVSLAELKKVATDLSIRAKEKPFRLLIHCGLSYPLEYQGRSWLPVDTQLRRTHNAPDGFGSDENYDLGTIRELDEDTIIYKSSEGREVEYEPTDRRARGCE